MNKLTVKIIKILTFTIITEIIMKMFVIVSVTGHVYIGIMLNQIVTAVPCAMFVMYRSIKPV